MHSPDELEKKRFDFLKKLYVASVSDETKFVNMYEIGSQLGFDNELTKSIALYLKGEGLIEFKALGGMISITHNGIKEVEKSFLPEQQQHETDSQSIMKKRFSKLNQDIQIFISYANEDYDEALKLYNELSNVKNLNPWMNKKSMFGGEKWKATISKAIRTSRFFIALLSSNSVTKKGYVQKELKEALDVLQEYPESGIYLIPARLDDCDVSDTRLEEINYIDLFPNWDEGFRSILGTIQHAEGEEVHTTDYETGYRAGVIKGQQDVDAFRSGQLSQLSGAEAPPCPLPDKKDYCKGWENGYTDQVSYQMDDED